MYMGRIMVDGEELCWQTLANLDVGVGWRMAGGCFGVVDGVGVVLWD